MPAYFEIDTRRQNESFIMSQSFDFTGQTFDSLQRSASLVLERVETTNAAFCLYTNHSAPHTTKHHAGKMPTKWSAATSLFYGKSESLSTSDIEFLHTIQHRRIHARPTQCLAFAQWVTIHEIAHFNKIVFAFDWFTGIMYTRRLVTKIAAHHRDCRKMLAFVISAHTAFGICDFAVVHLDSSELPQWRADKYRAPIDKCQTQK